jgi:hypothetical protein
MQMLAEDAYLNAFLGELHGQGIAYEIVSRHPVQLARIADFRKE